MRNQKENTVRLLPTTKTKKALENGYIKNVFDHGCASKNVISCYVRPGDPKELWLITEGEPKGAFASFRLRMPVITIHGVNSYRLSLEPDIINHMKSSGMKGVIVAFDADKHTNQAVLQYEQLLIDGLKEQGIPLVMKAEWDESNGKGIDDNLASGGKVRFIPT